MQTAGEAREPDAYRDSSDRLLYRGPRTCDRHGAVEPRGGFNKRDYERVRRLYGRRELGNKQCGHEERMVRHLQNPRFSVEAEPIR